MEEKKGRLDEELQDLMQEVEEYKQEKEKVREIVGKIGGAPTTTTKYLNVVFIVFVLADLATSLLSEGKLRLAMVELAIFAISLKLIYLIHKQSRVNHLQTWILSSLEWRVNEVLKEIRLKNK